MAEEVGLTIGEVAFAGRYAGSVATHEIFLARSDGTPVPNHREIQEATLLIMGIIYDAAQPTVLSSASHRCCSGEVYGACW